MRLGHRARLRRAFCAFSDDAGGGNRGHECRDYQSEDLVSPGWSTRRRRRLRRRDISHLAGCVAGRSGRVLPSALATESGIETIVAISGIGGGRFRILGLSASDFCLAARP